MKNNKHVCDIRVEKLISELINMEENTLKMCTFCPNLEARPVKEHRIIDVLNLTFLIFFFKLELDLLKMFIRVCIYLLLCWVFAAAWAILSIHTYFFLPNVQHFKNKTKVMLCQKSRECNHILTYKLLVMWN